MEKAENREEEWNMAQAYFKRIDYLLSLCCHSQMIQNLMGWENALKRLYTELEAKMSDKQKPKAKTLYNNLITAISVATNKGRIKSVKMSIKPFTELELYLRQVLEDKKMLTPKGDDPTKAYRG